MNTSRNKPDCRELRVLATNGRVFLLKVDEIAGLIAQPSYLVSLVLFCCLLGLVVPTIFGLPVFLPWRLVFWTVCGFVVVMAWYVQFRLYEWLQRKIGVRIVVPSALMIVLSVAALMHVNYGMAEWLLNQPDLWRGRLYPDILRYSLAAVAFETAVAVFLMPRMLIALRYRATRERAAQADAPERAPEPALPDRIEACGKRFDLAQVLYLKSAEHYVEVVLQDATELIRASLREMTDMLHPSQGVQPHRSYWVHRDAIVGLNRAEGGQFLVLRNGHEIPVSRHRRRDVADWIAAHVLEQDR